MNLPDTSHALAPDIAVLAPASFVARSTAQGLAASDPGTGVALSILLKPSAGGAVDDDRLLESAIALLQKRRTDAERLGVPAPIVIGGLRGRCALLRTTAASAPMHIVVTTLIVADPVNAAQQRNLIVVLEVPTPLFGQRVAYYQRFAQDRLRIGVAASMPELVPMPESAAPEPAAVKPESGRSPAPMPATAAPVGVRPSAQVAEPGEHELLASAALGQRTLAISIVLSFVARAVGNVPDVPVLLAYAVSAAVLFYAIGGVLRICSGFRYSQGRKLVLMFCSSVPLVGIVCWVWLSIRTTKRLRAAGFKVGLFGVRP